MISAMKKIFSLLIVCVASTLLAACASKPGELEISFNYNKQSGPGSNQYAVWVENASGEVVKTLFVTEFTSKGRSRDGSKPARGYTFRPSCVPTWVSHIGAENLTDDQMDAFTGATPSQSGVQTFTWDFTDQVGKPVAKGTYRIFLEATYNGASVVTYTGTVSSGQKVGELKLDCSYIEETEDRKDMITAVTAKVL